MIKNLQTRSNISRNFLKFYPTSKMTIPGQMLLLPKLTFSNILDIFSNAERIPRDSREPWQNVPLHVKKMFLHEERFRRAEWQRTLVVLFYHDG